VPEKIDQIINRLDSLHGLERELESVLQTLVLNDSVIIDAVAQMLGTIQQMQTRAEEIQKQLAQEVRQMRRELNAYGNGGSALGKPLVAGADQFERENPKIALLAHLAPHLEVPIAIDVGANVGAVSDRLLKAGCSVYAFEPHGPAFETLKQKLGSNRNFHALQFAIGSADSSMQLHIAKDLSGIGKWDTSLFHSLVEHAMLNDLQFGESVSVPVRSIDSLRQSREIPEHAGILKVDTEGMDLEVLRGLGTADYAIVMAEFWDPHHPFGMSGHGKLSDIVAEMNRRGYQWYAVIYHVDETATLSFYCNRDDTVPKAWGNAIFFRDRAMFARAVTWCEAVLKPTIFG